VTYNWRGEGQDRICPSPPLQACPLLFTLPVSPLLFLPFRPILSSLHCLSLLLPSPSGLSFPPYVACLSCPSLPLQAYPLLHTLPFSPVPPFPFRPILSSLRCLSLLLPSPSGLSSPPYVACLSSSQPFRPILSSVRCLSLPIPSLDLTPR